MPSVGVRRSGVRRFGPVPQIGQSERAGAPNFDAHLSVGITKPRRAPKIPARFRTNVVTEKEEDYFDDEEGMDTARDLLAAVTDNSEDDLYSPGIAFTPGLWLTSANVTCRGVFPAGTKMIPGAWVQVGESYKGTVTALLSKHAEMARKLGSGAVNGLLSADEWVAKKGRTVPGLNFEWCHIVADCLGGATAWNNLVAGGYHANTHMMYIEMACRGRGYLEVGVQVYVKDDIVAEYIVYNIRERGSNRASISFTIDSFSSGFSRKNRDDLTAALKPYIAQCKNYSIPV